MARASVETGPLVALDGEVPTAEQLFQRYRAIKASHLEMSRGRLSMLIALSVFDLGALVWAAYPAWRIVAVALIAVAISGWESWFVHTLPQRRSDGTAPLVLRFVLVLALAPVTGGIQSP